MTASRKRFSSYLWYSLGEIILVVIGILIAIQVNNWNEDRLEQRQIHVYARALASDLRDDIAALRVSAYQAQTVVNRINSMVDYMQHKSFDDLSNIDLYQYVRTMGYRPFAFNRAALGPMKSSGALHEIRNQELARKISEYEALTYHLEEDQVSDSRNARDAYLATNRVINRNFSGRVEIDKYFNAASDGETTDEAMRQFPSTEFYRHAKQNDVELVASDIRSVQEMANVLISYSGDLDARPGHELPRLMSMAQDLIDLIDTEYPDK